MKTAADVAAIINDSFPNYTVVMGDPASVYVMSKIQFAFLKIEKMENGLKLIQKTSWFGCRGYLAEVWACGVSGRSFNYDARNTPVADLHVAEDALPILVKNCEQEKLQAAIKLLNKIEDRLEWGDKTVLITLAGANPRPGRENDSDINIVIVPKNWSDSLPLLSLYLMIIRKATQFLYEDNDPMEFLKDPKATDYDRDKWAHLFQVDPDIVYTVARNKEFIFSDTDYKTLCANAVTFEAHDSGISSLVEIANSYMLNASRPERVEWNYHLTRQFRMTHRAAKKLAELLASRTNKTEEAKPLVSSVA